MSGRETRDLTESLDALMHRKVSRADNSDNSIPPPKERGESPAQTSAKLDAIGEGGGGKGINSPITETAYSDRQWFDEKTINTTDGIFAVRVRALKKLVMTDAKNNSVVMDFKEQV